MQNNPSKTKKAVSALALAGILIACFVGPVYASTYMTVSNSKAITANNNNVYCEIHAVQLKGPEEDFTIPDTSGGAGYSINHHVVLVQVKFTNYNAFPCTVRSFAPRFVFADGTSEVNRRVTNIENYTDEMYLSITNASSYFDVLPSVQFCDGSLINIPPHGSISAIARVEMVIDVPIQGNTETVLDYYYAQIQSIQLYNNGFIAEETSNYPKGTNLEIQMTLDQILENLTGNDTTNSQITGDSSSLKDTSDQIHQQEASYYAANTQAIEATGLSNYQFSTSQSNGIGAVRNDFVAIWNAMDGWTSVYIFSLTLGLALTIIRHAPSAISRRRRRSKE